MLVMQTVEGRTGAICQLPGGEQAVGFHHPSFAVYPLGLYRVEPRALFRQQAAYDPHSFAACFDPPVVGSDPLAHLFGGVPAGVVPDQNPNPLARHFELLAAPPQKLCRYAAKRATVHEPEPHLLEFGHIKPVAGDGLRIRIILFDRLLDKTHGLTRLCPAVEGGQSQPAPPALVTEAYCPTFVVLCQAHQPVAPPFFLWYSGSGLVIQRLARSQRTPIRARVARMVSPVIRSFVRPSSKLISAAISRVHRLLCLPNSLGELCKSSRRSSARSGSKAR